MKKITLLFFQTFLLLNLSACLLDDIIEEANLTFCPGQRVEDGSCSDEYDNLGAIDYSDSSKLNYDEEFFESNSQGTFLKSSGLIGDKTNFSKGNFHGTILDSSSDSLRPVSVEDDFTDIRKILSSYKDDLIAYYRFESDGSDSSPNGNNLSFNKGEVVTDTHAKISGNHLLLDGVDDKPFVSNPLGFDGLKEISMCVWVKHLSTTTSDDYLLSYFDSSGADHGRIQFFRDLSGAAYGRTLTYTIYIRDYQYNNRRIEASDHIANTNSWNHVCFSFKANASNGLKLFINGRESSNSPVDTSTLNGFKTKNPVLLLGSFNNGSRGNEAMDEIAIWGKEIPADKIKEIYYKQAPHFNSLNQKEMIEEDGLVAYYPLDGNWLDYSKNSNHATPHNNNTTDDALPGFSNDSQSGLASAVFDDTQLQYAGIPSTAELDALQESSFTLSAWYKPAAAPANDYNLNKRHGVIVKSGFHMGILYAENKKFRFDLWNSAGGYIGFSSSNYYTANKYYHIVAVLDYEAKQARLYVDSVLVGSRDYASMDIRSYASSIFRIGAGSYGTSTSSAGWPANGNIDEVSIWNKALSLAKVRQLYERGKQKIYSSYESPIYKLGAETAINKLKFKTPLPFYKTLSLEKETEYESLNSHLAKDLVAYYDFESESYDGSSDEVKDRINSYHATYTGGSKKMPKGVIGHGLGYSSISIHQSKNLKISNNFTFAFWFKAQALNPNNWYQIFRKGDPADKLSYFKMQLKKDSRVIALRMDVNGSSSQTLNSKTDVVDGKWHHINFTFDGSTLKLYIDGKFDRQMPITLVGDLDDPNEHVSIGSSAGGVEMDEVGIWKRALSAQEALALYRRTGNRIKYLIRTCEQADCSDQNWQGIKGVEYSPFSEIQNTGSLSKPDYIPNGMANQKSFDLLFNYLDTYPTKRKYFQYKVLFEAEENSACSSKLCLPELKSIEFGKESSYFKSSFAIVNKEAIPYSSLFSIKIKEKENCNLKFQLSNDGSNFYYYDSGDWISATELSQSNTKNQLSNNIKSFGNKFPNGSLYIKSILSSNGSNACGIESISLRGKE